MKILIQFVIFFSVLFLSIASAEDKTPASILGHLQKVIEKKYNRKIENHWEVRDAAKKEIVIHRVVFVSPANDFNLELEYCEQLNFYRWRRMTTLHNGEWQYQNYPTKGKIKKKARGQE